MINNGFIASLNYFACNNEGDRKAIYDYDNKINYTYNDLLKRSNRLSDFLLNKLGIKKGDRIAFFSPNCVEYFDAFYSCCKTGIILTSYNYLLKDEELINLINNEKPKVIFYNEKCEENICRLKKYIDVSHYVVLGNKNQYIEEKLYYEDILNFSSFKSVNSELVELEDIIMLIHTGGTTGTPKAAKISHRSIFYNSLSEVLTLGINYLDIAYVMLPLFHTAGWNVFTLPVLLCGGSIIINNKFTTKDTIKIINENKPTVMMGVPTIYAMLLKDEEFENISFNTFRYIITGAAPCPQEILNEYWNREIKISQGYGMTEIGPNNLFWPKEYMNIDIMKEKWNSVGKPMYFNKVKIVDDNGIEVKDGEIGELIWKSCMNFSGYWGINSNEDNITIDGWIYSGDLGKKDEDGFYYISGRKKNMFITGGENIFPIEIENVIHKYKDIEDVCVIGIQDEKWGEVGKALIVLKKGTKIDVKDLNKYLKKNLTSIKIPKYIEIVDEIPKNSVGKIQINKIKEMYGNAI